MSDRKRTTAEHGVVVSRTPRSEQDDDDDDDDDEEQEQEQEQEQEERNIKTQTHTHRDTRIHNANHSITSNTKESCVDNVKRRQPQDKQNTKAEEQATRGGSNKGLK